MKVSESQVFYDTCTALIVGRGASDAIRASERVSPAIVKLRGRFAPICSSGAPAPETGQDQAILTYRRREERIWCMNDGEGQALALR